MQEGARAQTQMRPRVRVQKPQWLLQPVPVCGAYRQLQLRGRLRLPPQNHMQSVKQPRRPQKQLQCRGQHQQGHAALSH